MTASPSPGVIVLDERMRAVLGLCRAMLADMPVGEAWWAQHWEADAKALVAVLDELLGNGGAS